MLTFILEEVSANAEIERMKKTFLDRVDRAVKSAKEYSDKYMDYNFLWTNNRKEFLGTIYYELLVLVIIHNNLPRILLENSQADVFSHEIKEH